MASESVEIAINSMGGMNYYQAIEYLHTLPKGMPARVMGEILDRAQAIEATEKLHRRVREGLARMIKAEKNYDSFYPHSL